MKVVNGLTLFWDGIFSNFHPCKFEVDGIKFNCSEQYFMYKKAMTFNDVPVAELILESIFPSEQKHLGRGVGDFDGNVWDEVKFKHMYDACYAKFSQNPDLKEQLLNTIGTRLVEASPYDKIWGIGFREDDPNAHDPSLWKGLNLLGEVLDDVRATLMEEDKLNETTN
jgi:ribA/ribD-fused uncharacterized protein